MSTTARAPRGGYGDQRILSAIAVAAVLLMLPVVILAGHFQLVTIPLIVLAALLVAADRDSLYGMAAVGILALLWIAARPATLSPWTLVTALLLFTIHAALALRTTEPPGASLGPVTVRRWVVRCGVVAAVTAGVYGVSLVLHLAQPHNNDIVVVLALVLLGALILLLRHESVEIEPS